MNLFDEPGSGGVIVGAEARRRALEEVRSRYRDEQCEVDDANAIGRGDHYDTVTEAIRSGTVRVRTRRQFPDGDQASRNLGDPS